MNAPRETRYTSPLRDEQAQGTRDRILDAVRTLFEADPDSALAFDEIAATAGVARRTVFRHFADKEALLDAFWARTNQSMGVRFWPESERDLVTMPPDLFEALEGIAGIVRASHASAAGRMMRMRANPERQAAFRASLAQVAATLDPVRARQLEAVVQLLFSATAWQSMKDYWGLDGRAAGEAVAWAIATLLDAVRPPARTRRREEMNDLSVNPAPAASIHPARDASPFWVMGDRVALRARLPGPNLWVVDVEVPPGSGVPPHTHASPEIFIVQEGLVRFWTDAGEADAGPGDVLTIPPHAPHGYRNASAAPARFTGLVDDSMAAFFEAAARPVPPPPGPPPAEEIGRIMALAAQAGITMLPPPGSGT